MNSKLNSMIITKIWFDDNRIYGLTDDGRTLWQSLRLMYATPEEREKYRMGFCGIHWEELDECGVVINNNIPALIGGLYSKKSRFTAASFYTH